MIKTLKLLMLWVANGVLLMSIVGVVFGLPHFGHPKDLCGLKAFAGVIATLMIYFVTSGIMLLIYGLHQTIKADQSRVKPT